MNRNILVIDCGSTGIRSIIINSKGEIIHRDYKRIEILHPEEGATENSPEHIWESFKDIVNKSIHLPLIKIETISITNQRSTFALWDKHTGNPLTNFINWQDVRSAETAKKMNKNLVWKSLKFISFFIGRLFKNPLLTVTSMLIFNTDHSICKLKWVLDNNKDIKGKCNNKDVMFGTIDTWLLYKLTGNKEHKTDYTNAAATSLLNPFIMKWNTLFCGIFNIPMHILPKVYNTNDYFGYSDKKIFGKEIPITCMVGDQQASLFGHKCFNTGDLKITLGSGGFVSMNVGPKPKFSTKGLFPLIAWTINGIPQYKLEGQIATVGTFLDWIVEKMEIFKSVQEIDKLALECDSANGIYVTPTLTGIRFPYFKPNFNSSINGLTLQSDKRHLARAIIEGITHRVVDIVEGMETETKINITSIKVDGGVSNSDVIMQLLSDLTGKTVYRSTESDLASIGAGYFSGLTVGIWKNKEEINNINNQHMQFNSKFSENRRKLERDRWNSHIKATIKYYK